jgi:suppressor of fused-like protein
LGLAVISDDAPGWTAIDNALESLYPGVAPQHVSTAGPDPLDGISFYLRDEPVPHWHIVTYGMSDLYTEEYDTPGELGWAFEFTFRVRRAPDEDQPPMWAAALLQNLGRYVVRSGNAFAPGHHVDTNGPIRLGRDTRIRAIAFTTDAELGTVDTPHGRLLFLQVVGITTGEYAAMRAWHTDRVLELIASRYPLLVTDLDRPSLSEEEEFAATVRQGQERDGSSTGFIAVTDLRWAREEAGIRVVIGANAATRVAQTLLGRLPHGNELVVGGTGGQIVFRPGADHAWAETPRGLELVVPAAALPGLAEVLVPRAGVRAVPQVAGLVVEVVPTYLRDAAGNVIETIG